MSVTVWPKRNAKVADATAARNYASKLRVAVASATRRPGVAGIVEGRKNEGWPETWGGVHVSRPQLCYRVAGVSHARATLRLDVTDVTGVRNSGA